MLLKNIQQIFVSDVIDVCSQGDYLPQQDFSADELLQIYRNNYFLGLLGALKSTYSCVLRLVGEGFFKTLAKEYVKSYPLTQGNLLNYGGHFPEFIKHFKPCQSYGYLADVAYFECYYEQCYHHKNVRFLMRSDYPIIDIWQLNENSGDLDLTKGGQFVLIQKTNLEVVISLISREDFLQLGGKNGQII